MHCKNKNYYNIKQFKKTKIMKKNSYVAPELELLELVVEAGFATSGYDGQTPSYDEEELPSTY